MADSAALDKMTSELTRCGQEKLSEHLKCLSSDDQCSLMRDLNLIGVSHARRCFELCTSQSTDISDKITPVDADHCASRKSSAQATLENFTHLGLKAIGEGKVGVILLAGGQGTRLGFSHPKGMFNVGLPSSKTLFQLQAERILSLQQLAGGTGKILWCIMTSDATRAPTEAFFSSKNFFGLDHEQVVFFDQGFLPCFDFDGQILLESPLRVAKAPDGNGGLYRALVTSGVLEKEIIHRGVQHLHVYCVDNVLVRVADPAFIGFCISNNADCAAKVVQKTFPSEAVGVVCLVGDPPTPRVVEYSELPKELAEARDTKDGKLAFRAGNIANHYFHAEFLREVCTKFDDKLPLHVARKKIACYDVEAKREVKAAVPNGIKIEKFVFDVFPFSKSFYVWEVPREEEFSPLKNADAPDADDCATTCRRDLYALHRKWLVDAGARLPADTDVERVCEISPLVSYAGEGLERVRGRVFDAFPICVDEIQEKKSTNNNEQIDGVPSVACQ